MARFIYHFWCKVVEGAAIGLSGFIQKIRPSKIYKSQSLYLPTWRDYFYRARCFRVLCLGGWWAGSWSGDTRRLPKLIWSFVLRFFHLVLFLDGFWKIIDRLAQAPIPDIYPLHHQRYRKVLWYWYGLIALKSWSSCLAGLSCFGISPIFLRFFSMRRSFWIVCALLDKLFRRRRVPELS